MRQSREAGRGRRSAVTIAVALVLAATGLAAPSVGSGGSPVARVVLLGLLGLLVAFVVVQLGLQLAGSDTEAPLIAGQLARDLDQQRLLARWLERARWARFVGGLSGLTVWFLGTNAQGDVLLLGTGGIAAGAVLAELHHVRRGGGPRTARLEARSVSDYLSAHDARQMASVAVAAVAAAVLGGASGEAWPATWWGLGALAALGAARLAQRRVATRARPAVADRLRHADDLVRQLAIGRGLAQPATYVALAMLARAFGALEPVVGAVAPVLGAVAWVAAVVLWWRNRRLGLDALVAEGRAPLLA